MFLSAAVQHRAIPCHGKHSRFAVPAGIAAGCHHHKPQAIFISSKQMQSSPLNSYKIFWKGLGFFLTGEGFSAPSPVTCARAGKVCGGMLGRTEELVLGRLAGAGCWR